MRSSVPRGLLGATMRLTCRPSASAVYRGCGLEERLPAPLHKVVSGVPVQKSFMVIPASKARCFAWKLFAVSLPSGTTTQAHVRPRFAVRNLLAQLMPWIGPISFVSI